VTASALHAAPAEDVTDDALVARLAQQDEGALRELHRRYAPLVFTVASRFVPGAVAEEVVQDVFVTLWTKHATFDPARGAFKPWIAQIARRRALNALRRTPEQGRSDADALDQIEGEALAPDEARWLAHRRAVLRAAVEALPEAQRRALSLAFFDELTHEQVAAVLGTPVGTAKTRIRSAIKRLAPALLAALAAAAIGLAVWRREEVAARDAQALRMVTASDVVPLRLTPTPEAPAEAHGSYRSRRGASVAVLTTSHLPVAAPGQRYVAWARGAEGWRQLGIVVVEGDGRSLLVAEAPSGGAGPEELRVTLESDGAVGGPRGPAMLGWTAAGGP
jgi:RNA polymerase sigma-70 factor (ECF subfamily)